MILSTPAPILLSSEGVGAEGLPEVTNVTATARIRPLRYLNALFLKHLKGARDER